MRLPSIDILRVLVVAFIVFRHNFGSSDLMILSVGVPFFFFLTGWLWRPGKRTVCGEINHRWHTLGVPYVTWLLLLYPAFLVGFAIQRELTWQRAISPLLGGSYIGAAYTTFWFISALLLVGVLMRCLDRLNKVSLLLLSLWLLAVGGWFGTDLAVVPLGFGVAIPSLGFTIIGHLLYEASSRTIRHSVLIAGVSLLAAVPLTFLCAPINIKYGDFGTPLASALLACVIIFAAIICLDGAFSLVQDRGARLERWLSPITQVAIIVVLTHPVVIWVLSYFVPTDATVWVFITALVFPWAFALTVAHTPLARFLVGRSQQRPKAVGHSDARA